MRSESANAMLPMIGTPAERSLLAIPGLWIRPITPVALNRFRLGISALHCPFARYFLPEKSPLKLSEAGIGKPGWSPDRQKTQGP